MSAFRTTNVIKVTVNASSGVISSVNPVTVKSIPSISSTPSTRLDQLSDVYAVNETDKATLVYDAATDKYVVKKLEFNELDGPLDGGTF